MSSPVVGLDGKPIDPGDPPSNEPLAILKRLVAEIEAGTLVPTSIYIIMQTDDPEDPSCIRRPTWDSGLTASEAVFLLEIEKVAILKAMLDT